MKPSSKYKKFRSSKCTCLQNGGHFVQTWRAYVSRAGNYLLCHALFNAMDRWSRELLNASKPEHVIWTTMFHLQLFQSALDTSLYPPLQRSWKGVYWFHLVRPSARLSVCPSVDRIVSALYLQQYSSDPFHIWTSYQATSDGVSRVKVWQLFKFVTLTLSAFDLGSNRTQ